jgi:hypothetical protein
LFPCTASRPTTPRTVTSTTPANGEISDAVPYEHRGGVERRQVELKGVEVGD